MQLKSHAELFLIEPDWPAPSNVRSFVTTRKGGISTAPYDTLNLGDRVGDQHEAVSFNRQLIRNRLPSDPIWLKQVHGTEVWNAKPYKPNPQVIEADAAFTVHRNVVVTVTTADCLPIFFCSRIGNTVGVAHAGWRGLCNGVIENTIHKILSSTKNLQTHDLMVWFGPAIGPKAFEVGDDVLREFSKFAINHPIEKLMTAFEPIHEKPGKYLANLYLLAKLRLNSLGISEIYGGNFCTYQDHEQFFSYRRDGCTGRFASLIWFE